MLVVDTAHGHSQGVLDVVREMRQRFPNVDLVAGNVATAEGTEALIDAGVDAVKVGIGAGSICTTRIIAGIGVPMITAICRMRRGRRARHDVPVIADGGIRFSGDITKAIAVGASTTMIGNLLRRHRRKPGRADPLPGPHASRNTAAWARSARCARAAAIATSRTSSISTAPDGIEKLVPEGIEGRVAAQGLGSPAWSISSSAACAPAWATAAARPSRICSAKPSSFASPRPACARATSTT